jgi:integrase
MGRRAEGQLIVLTRARGRVFALRFRAYGRREYLTLGTAEDGWNRAKAQTELENVLADVRRGIWRPPQPTPVSERPNECGFHEFASEWFAHKEREVQPNTARSYRNDLTRHLLPFFHDHQLSQITIAEVDRYRQAKVREGVLKPRSINMHLALLAQILEVAVEYGHLERNSASGRRRRLRAPKPQSVHLDTAEHLASLLCAARQLDGESKSHTSGRAAAIALLLFAGLRAHEASSLLWRDLDLGNRRLHVGQSKTDAGEREVDLMPVLVFELNRHRLRSDQTRPQDHVLLTSKGKPRDRHNLRQRVVAPVVRRASGLLAELDAPPLPEGISPHKLRHTFASLLVALGSDPAALMAQLGHTDPAFTLRVYAHMMRRDPLERERLRALVEGDLDLDLDAISKWRVLRGRQAELLLVSDPPVDRRSAGSSLPT